MKTRKNFSGNVAGYINCRKSDLGCAELIASCIEHWEINYNYENTHVSYWNTPIYVSGHIDNGYESGNWQLYGANKELIGDVSFDNETKTVHFVVYLYGQVLCDQFMDFSFRTNKNRSCRKFSYLFYKKP